MVFFFVCEIVKKKLKNCICDLSNKKICKNSGHLCKSHHAIVLKAVILFLISLNHHMHEPVVHVIGLFTALEKCT